MIPRMNDWIQVSGLTSVHAIGYFHPNNAKIIDIIIPEYTRHIIRSYIDDVFTSQPEKP